MWRRVKLAGQVGRAWLHAEARRRIAQVATWGRWAAAQMQIPRGDALGAWDWRAQVGVECAHCGTVPAPACTHYYATAWAGRGEPTARDLLAAGVRRLWFAPGSEQLVIISLDSGALELVDATGKQPPVGDYLEGGRVSLAALLEQVADLRTPL